MRLIDVVEGENNFQNCFVNGKLGVCTLSKFKNKNCVYMVQRVCKRSAYPAWADLMEIYSDYKWEKFPMYD